MDLRHCHFSGKFIAMYGAVYRNLFNFAIINKKNLQMSKKKDIKVTGDMLDAFSQAGSPMEGVLQNIPVEDEDRLVAMFHAYITGVTAEQYEAFLKQVSSPELRECLGMVDDMFADAAEKMQQRHPEKKQADDRTLVLKIQMNGVTKPPMWREVEVPAGYNFLQLHDIIQTVMGFYNEHLWIFVNSLTSRDIRIGIPLEDEDNWGAERMTSIADETPITKYLAAKGDKLYYEYDFGDSWTFTIEVKAVLDKESEYPVCTKYKGELNPTEDSGGIPGYMYMRDCYENKDVESPFGTDEESDDEDSWADVYFGYNPFNKEIVNIELKEI